MLLETFAVVLFGKKTRSQCVFSKIVKQYINIESWDSEKISRLYCIDMSTSERFFSIMFTISRVGTDFSTNYLLL